MPDLNNNAKNDDALDGLKEKDLKETQEIIKEIGGDTQPDKPEEKPEEKPEPKKPVEEPKEKPEEKPKEPEEKKEEKSRKTKLIPAEVHYTARAKWEQEKRELESKLADAARGSAHEKKEAGDDKKSQDQVDAELRRKTDALATKFGTDPDEEYEKAIAYRDTFSPTIPKVEIPKEITDGIEEIKTYKQEQQIKAEEAHFNSDFDNKILPLIKAEYGDDVPTSTIEDVKEKVKAKAYSEDYAKVPLATIYKGEDEFRDVIPKKQHGSEKSRGGFQQSQQVFKTDELDLAIEQTDDVVSKMTPDQFDTYSNNMARREKR